ncbi:MAG: neutral/alkaline non-lysosomal ceramidase N-terminal domain-containing protein [Candidatus Omnitrophica bacterium]|nr:neutral/alkaline non-lysosomal ceramidase N-terminal domain-containing protein [Candidatus Omnitrophota bacterium]
MAVRSPQSAVRRTWKRCRLPSAVCGLFLSCLPLGAWAEVTVGVAKEEFQLPAKVPLAGYSRRKGRPSTGRHDPVGVRALVLQDEETTVAMASGDLLIVDERLFAAVERRLAAEGLPAGTTLFFSATHTHSGPGAYGSRFLEKISMGHFDPAVFDAIVSSASRAIGHAYRARRPAAMACACASPDGLVTNRVEEGGFVDNELPVCAFYERGSSTPLAVMVAFAAHPTTLGAWNMELSADYPGVVIRELEQRFPQAVAVFFAASVGDQAPVKSGDRFERAEFLGAPLARHAERVLAGASPQPVSAVQALQQRLLLPPARLRFSRHVALPSWLSRRFVDDDATVSVVRIGEAVWFGAPCDLSASLGRQLKEAARARGLFPIVAGFANDYIGYCMPAARYESGEYEALMGFNGPHAGELVVARLIELLDSVANSKQQTANSVRP